MRDALPADELPHVFSIAQAHGARLGVDSEVGVGTTFSLDLPLAFD